MKRSMLKGILIGILALCVSVSVLIGASYAGRLNWIGHWQNEHDREKLVREVAQEFRFLNPDIELNLKFPQELQGLRSKPEIAKFYAEMIKTGNFVWDVIWLDDQSYQYVAEELDDPEWGKKHLVDFGKVDGFKNTQKSFILSDPTYAQQTGGIIALPESYIP